MTVESNCCIHYSKKVDLEDLLNYASIGFDYETKAVYAQHFI